jgi:hypothetical protein
MFRRTIASTSQIKSAGRIPKKDELSMGVLSTSRAGDTNSAIGPRTSAQACSLTEVCGVEEGGVAVLLLEAPIMRREGSGVHSEKKKWGCSSESVQTVGGE